MFKGRRFVVELKGTYEKSPCTNLEEILNLIKLFCFCACKMFILGCYLRHSISPPDCSYCSHGPNYMAHTTIGRLKNQFRNLQNTKVQSDCM